MIPQGPSELVRPFRNQYSSLCSEADDVRAASGPWDVRWRTCIRVKVSEDR